MRMALISFDMVHDSFLSTLLRAFCEDFKLNSVYISGT